METLNTKRILLAAVLATGTTIAITAQASFAAITPDIDPEVSATTWQDQNREYASVTLNGKELVTYKGQLGSGSAEQKAEDFAAKLNELINNSKIDPSKLMPAREGELAAIRIDGATVIKFDLPDVDQSNKKPAGTPVDQSLKVVNALRAAFGAPALPSFTNKVVVQDGAKLSNVPTFSGHASWYGGKFHGRRSSDGSRFDQDGLTAAHRSLPFGTKLLVTNRRTGDSCVVQVTDRGPFVDGRVLDLSRGAARALNMVSSGVALVDCRVLADQ